MFRSSSKKKQAVIDEAVKEIDSDLEETALSPSLEKNMALLNNLFKDDDTFITKYITNMQNAKARFGLVYCASVTDLPLISENVIQPLTTYKELSGNADLITGLMEQVVQIGDIERTTNVASLVEGICYGDTVLFVDGESEALILSTKNLPARAVTEPDNERVLNGPREGFNESIIASLAMLRRRVRSNKLKMKYYAIGRRTKTQTCICYMDGLVNEKILKELYKRLDKIDIDGVLDENYISELIKDSPLSPFRTTGYTERPDTVIARLLEGRIALIVDGSPSVLTLPFLFVENFQSGEDYYMNFYYASFSRMLRIFGFFLTLVVPGLYIAIVAYHHEMLPTQLLLNIAVERQGAPLPASIEAFVMLIVFDILRETGVRMPNNIGQALSIVGALVIGQSAVEAKMVAAPMIIIVALTGITNLLVPRLSGPVIFIRYFFLFAASVLGFYGLVLAMTVVVIHILNLRTFGIPQVSVAGNVRFQEIKDTAFRAPWWKMRLRPKRLTSNKTRMKTGGNSS
jgi:spore germination protein KA